VMNPREQDNKLESLNYFRMPQKVPTKCCGSSLRSRPPYLSEESEADESRTYHRDLAWGGGGGEARFVPPPKPRRRLRYSVTRWPRTAGRAAGGRTGRLVDPRGPWAALPFFRLIVNGRLELQVQVCMFGSRPVS